MTTGYSVTDAERARIERIDALVALGPDGVEPLLAALEDPTWTVRRAAIASLAALGDDAAPALCTWLRSKRTTEHAIAAVVDALVAARGTHVVTEVLRLLDASEPAILADACVILGRRRAVEASDALVAVLRSEDDNVAVAAIEALGNIGGNVAFDALADLMQHPSFFRTFAALQVLATSGDPRAVRAIEPLLADPLYRDEAIHALGRTGSPQAVASLVQLLDSSPLELVAPALASALATARWNGAEATLAGEISARLPAASARFVAALEHATTELRGALAELLGWIGETTAIRTLANMLEVPDDAGAARRALEGIAARTPAAVATLLSHEVSAARAIGLAAVRLRSSAPAVRELLSDDEPELRALACEALARLGDTTSLEQLFDRLGDPSPRVAHAAAAAIQSLGNAQIADLAAAAARSPSASIRRHALRIFGYLGLPDAFDTARRALGDPDSRVVESAIAILGVLDDERCTALISELALSPEEPRRIAAIRAAGHRVNDAMYALCERALSDDSAWVRYYACHGVARQWRPGSAAPIIARLADPTPHVRLAAIEALAVIRTADAWEAVLAAADSPDPDQRRAALSGLALHDREASLDVLIAAVGSPDIATRLVALAAVAPSSSPRALEVLVEATRAPVTELRDAALSLLAERTDRAAADALIDAALAVPATHPAHLALSQPGAARISAIEDRLASADPSATAALVAALARMRAREATDVLVRALDASNPIVRRAAATTLSASGTAGAAAHIARLAHTDPDAEVRRVCATLIGR